MTNTSALEEAIRNSGLKVTFLADKLGISYGAFRYKVKGSNEFKASEINLLSNILRLSEAEVFNIFFSQECE